MKVYIFVHHSVTDYEDTDIFVQAYADEDDAIEALAQWRSDEIGYVNKYDYKIITDSKYEFCAYAEGFWSRDHTIGYIEECELL